MSLPSVQQGCGGSGGHGSAPGGRFKATLRAGSPWWSSGGTTPNGRAPPAGRPNPKLAGTVPRNGSYDRCTPRTRVVQWLISHVVTGVRTSSIVGMLGPELLVHVPAALRECRGRTRAGNPPRATVPRNGGLHPWDWRAPTQGLAGDIFQHCRLQRVHPGLRRIRVRGRLWRLYSGWEYYRGSLDVTSYFELDPVLVRLEEKSDVSRRADGQD